MIAIFQSDGKTGMECQIIDESPRATTGDYVIRAVKLASVFNAQFVRSVTVKDGILLGDWTSNEYGTEVWFWQGSKFEPSP